MDQLNEIAKVNKLVPFEKPSNIYLTEEEWTINDDLLTPTSKLKRPQMRSHFQNEIRECYKEKGFDWLWTDPNKPKTPSSPKVEKRDKDKAVTKGDSKKLTVSEPSKRKDDEMVDDKKTKKKKKTEQ